MSDYKLSQFSKNLALYGQQILKLSSSIKDDISLFYKESDPLYEHVSSLHQHTCLIVSSVTAGLDNIQMNSKQYNLSVTQELVSELFLVQKALWEDLYEMAAPLRNHTEKMHVGLLFITVVEALNKSQNTLEKAGEYASQYKKP